MTYDYLIIGGGITGVTAAETIREQDSHARIAIVSEEPHLIYSRVLLPSYVKKRIPRDKVFLRSSEDFVKKRIDLHLQERVMRIDTAYREIFLQNGSTLGYEKLLIATGGKPHTWGKPEDANLVYQLQTIDDAERLLQMLDAVKQPIVVGDSFIGLEFLEILVLNGIAPALIVRGDHFFSHFVESTGGKLIDDQFRHKGITPYYNDVIATISAEGGLHIAETRTLKKIPFDIICVGVGIERSVDLVQGTEIKVGKRGILVNEFLETNIPEIFAGGDVAEYYNGISGAYRIEGNWTNAVLQGKRAGLNMTGAREPFRAVGGYSITNLGFHFTAVGDCSAHENTIVRVDPLHKRYERLFLREGILAGAFLINKFQDKPHIARLIERQTNVAPWREQLNDLAFDIHTIPVVG